MCISGFKKPAQKPSSNHPKQYPKHNGDWNINKVHELCTSSLRHTGKGRKQHDYINIITGSTCQNHLRDTLFCSVMHFHQLNHPRNHNRRRNSGKHCTHHCRFNSGNAKQIRCKQEESKQLKACRYKCHHNGRSSHLFQVCQIQGQPRLNQNND